MSIFSKLFSRENKESLDQGLAKTKESFFGKLAKAIAGKYYLDWALCESLDADSSSAWSNACQFERSREQ